MDDAPLHLWRHRSCALVDRHDPARVNRLARLFIAVKDFVLRICDLKAAPPSAPFDGAEQDHSLATLKHVAHERLVQPDGANRTALVANERLENLEAGPAGSPKPAVDNLAGKRSPVPRLQALNGTETSAVLVSKGKSLEQIFHRLQPDPLQV